jgi:hypothetical protein
MFKLVESINREPIRFPVAPEAKLTPGHIVSVYDHDGTLVIDICDGINPFGILGNRCIGGNVIDFKKVAKVFPQRMIADINKFDRKSNIEVGSSLYCNKHGMLTSQKPCENSLVLAKVITPASENKKYMQILWL